MKAPILPATEKSLLLPIGSLGTFGARPLWSRGTRYKNTKIYRSTNMYIDILGAGLRLAGEGAMTLSSQG